MWSTSKGGELSKGFLRRGEIRRVVTSSDSTTSVNNQPKRREHGTGGGQAVAPKGSKQCQNRKEGDRAIVGILSICNKEEDAGKAINNIATCRGRSRGS